MHIQEERQSDHGVHTQAPSQAASRSLVQEFEKRYPGEVAVTAPTGIAAVSVGGQTIHSWSGIGLEVGPEVKNKKFFLMNRIKRSPAASARWLKTRILVIDEVSMLDPELFELLANMACDLRKNKLQKFGGMQLLLCGDFLQLPPVVDSRQQAHDVVPGRGAVKRLLQLRSSLCGALSAYRICGALDQRPYLS